MATIVVREGRLLLGRRTMEGSCAGLWEFPGGKVEPGESDEEALIREFDEEFGASIEAVEPIAETSFVHRGQRRVLAAWVCRLAPDASLSIREHAELRWCLPGETAELEFVDSDSRLLKHVLDWMSRSVAGASIVPGVE